MCDSNVDGTDKLNWWKNKGRFLVFACVESDNEVGTTATFTASAVSGVGTIGRKI
jgi:hypothetical protein